MTSVDSLAALFKETAQAHHQAFAATDGADPEWALWYAHALKPKLDKLHIELSESDLVHLLIDLDQEHQARASDRPWPEVYAEAVLERYEHPQGERLSLYKYDACPFCAMVLREIASLGIDVEMRDVLLEPRYREELIDARGRGTVPVLRCDGPDGVVRWMPESRDIIKYLRQQYATK